MGTIKKIFAMMVIMLFSLGTGLTAQTGTESQNPGDPVIQNQENNLDTVNATESIVVDTARSTSGQTIAREMSLILLEKMNISFDQAGDVEEILIEYQEDIAEAKNRGTTSATDQGVTDTETGTDENTATDDDREILGGMDNDANLSEIDRETNEKLEEVFSDDQMSTYLFVKDDWWNEVKSRVYGTDIEQNLDQQNIDTQGETDSDFQGETDTDVEGETETDVQGETDTDTQGETDDEYQDVSPDTGRSLEQNQAPADSTKY